MCTMHLLLLGGVPLKASSKDWLLLLFTLLIVVWVHATGASAGQDDFEELMILLLQVPGMAFRRLSPWGPSGWPSYDGF